MIPDFDRFPAGDDLDWLVLHHALDWKLGFPALGQKAYLTGAREPVDALWPVSTEWSAAERVVRALEARGLRFEVGPGSVQVMGASGVVEAEGETEALAVARGVMKAVVAVMITKGY